MATNIMDSYQFIGTCAAGSGALTNWSGPHSDVALYAAGNTGSQVPVSAFDLGDSIAEVPTDVLNTGSALGSDELDLTSKFASMAASATSLYSTTNAAVFNWNGNPATPGYGANNFSLNTTTGTLIDSLNASDWGLIKNYELSLNTANAPGISTVLISNFEDTNVQIIGAGAMVAAYQAQRGDFDMSQATGDSGHVLFYLAPVAPVGTTSVSTFTYKASHDGDQLLIGPRNGQDAATTVYGGTPLLTDGSTSLLDFYDNHGGNTIVLQDAISSNLYLNGGEATLTFINSATVAGWGAATAAQGGDFVQLNPTGGGAAKISDSDASGVTLIANFILGRDHLDIALLAGSGTYTVSDLFLGGNAALAQDNAVAITDPTGERGVVVTGMFATTAAAHISTTIEGGQPHLLFS